MLLYHNGNNGHFLFDFNMWSLHYHDLGWGGILTCFTDKSMHHMGHLLPFFIFTLFGYNAIAWTLALTALHSLNAVLIFAVIQKILSAFNLQNTKQIAIVTVALFLCSPLHTEVVVWASAVWYLQSLALILAAILAVISYLQGNNKSLIYYYVFLVLAFFTWEISFSLPFITLLLLLFSPTGLNQKIRNAVAVVLPSFGCIVLYVVINKLRSGSWVSHYGEEQHLRFPVVLIVKNLTGYLLKLSAINAMYSYRIKDYIFDHIKPLNVSQIIIAVVIILSIVVSYFVRRRPQLKAAWLFLLISLAAILPVINLYPGYIKDIEQDRYLYIASVFFYASIATFGYSLRFVWGRYVLIASYAVLLLFYQHRFVKDWQMAGNIQSGLLNSFSWPNAERLIILCDADNVNGAYCLRSQPYSSFAEALLAHKNINVRDKVIEVLQFNMVSPNDSMSAERIDSVTIKTTFAQWGNWYWKMGAGATSYETPDFKVKVDEWSHSFVTTMKRRYPGDVFIYQAKDHWEEVRM